MAVDDRQEYRDAGNGSFIMWGYDVGRFMLYSDSGVFQITDDNTGFVVNRGMKVRVELYDKQEVMIKSFKMWMDMGESARWLTTRNDPKKVTPLNQDTKIWQIFETLKNGGSVCMRARRPGRAEFDMMIKSQK